MSTTDLPDVNVLFALFKENHLHHHHAQNWLRYCEKFATTPMTEAGFLRLAMTRTPIDEPVSSAAAIERLGELKKHPKAVFWPDNTSLTDNRAIIAHLTGPKQVTDTHLLNLAISYGGRLVTFDQRITPSLTRSLRKHVLQLG